MSQRRRDADRATVASKLGLAEQGGPRSFTLPSGDPFAVAYTRVVYGDRGPYVELEREHIIAPLASMFCNDLGELPPIDCGHFYLWLYPVGDPSIKVYWQIKPVRYADYKRGLYYVYPFSIVRAREGSEPAQVDLFEIGAAR